MDISRCSAQVPHRLTMSNRDFEIRADSLDDLFREIAHSPHIHWGVSWLIDNLHDENYHPDPYWDNVPAVNYIRDDCGRIVPRDFILYCLDAFGWINRRHRWNYNPDHAPHGRDYRKGPVPGIHRRRRYRALRRMRYMPAKRESVFHKTNPDCLEYGLQIRGKKSLPNIPDSWDDYIRSSVYDRNWKKFRRTQYHPR